MKGDFTRLTFDPRKRYSGVLMQQGRVQLDADWNEQLDILMHRIETETRDLIGMSGAPVDAPGFEVLARNGELVIGPGRFYVDGLLCENETEVSYGRQEDYPDAPLPVLGSGRTLHVAYLDAWLRYVSSAEDPSLLETALGGPDTAGRVQVVAQVKLLQLDRQNESFEFDESHPDWKEFVARGTRKALMRARRLPTATHLGNQLYRVEVHTGGTLNAAPRPDQPYGTSVDVRRTETDDGLQVTVGDWVVDGVALQVGQVVELFGGDAAAERNPGRLLRVAAANQAEKTLTLFPPIDLSGQAGLRLRPVVTIKWSRENGSVVFLIAAGDPKNDTLTLADLGQDEYALQVGDWVEVLDDTHVLQGRPGTLCQVSNIDRTSSMITFPKGTLPNDFGDNSASHPRLRRWDQKPTDDLLDAWGAVPVEATARNGGWINLEAGIQIAFEDSGTLQTGDYWLIPSRTLTGNVEWPQTDSSPAALPPRGVRHHYAPLALVLFEGESLRVRDYRRKFAPLTAFERDEECRCLKKGSDTLSGEPRIDNSPRVAGEISGDRPDARPVVAQNVESAASPGRLDDNAVGEGRTVDKAATRAKPADDVSVTDASPPGCSLLGDSPTPPPGYTYTGSYVFAVNPHLAWQIKASMKADNVARLFGAAVGDKIYTFTDAGAVWEYDTASAVWGEKNTAPSGARPLGVAAVNGLIYVFCASGDVWQYNPAPGDGDQAWERKAPMPKPRHAFGIAVSGGKIYLAGGRRKIFSGLLTITSRENEAYDPATDTWRRQSSMPRRRSAFGGNEDAAWTHSDKSLPLSEGRTEAPPPPVAITSPCAVMVNGKAYVLGPDASNPQTCLVAELAAGSTYYVHRKD